MNRVVDRLTDETDPFAAAADRLVLARRQLEESPKP